MDNCFITFIVPVYKIEKEQLNRCVKSILEQRNYRKEYEILLIDDGSPDDCPKICDAYVAQYNNVRVLHRNRSTNHTCQQATFCEIMCQNGLEDSREVSGRRRDTEWRQEYKS